MRSEPRADKTHRRSLPDGSLASSRAFVSLRKPRHRHFRAAALLLLCGTAAFAAGAPWTSEADVSVTVNGHSFHHARVDGQGCHVSVHLAFAAPAKGYSDPRNLVRNYHRFRARVRMAKGQVIASGIFGNSGAGERTYSFDDDTSAQGCWSKEPGKLVKVEVIGCRGRGCDVGSFE